MEKYFYEILVEEMENSLSIKSYSKCFWELVSLGSTDLFSILLEYTMYKQLFFI